MNSEQMHAWPRRAYADGPFGQIHYQFTGEGDAIILLHQAPMTSAQFDNVYMPLARHGFQVIGIDMPGFGNSDPAPGVPTAGDYAQIVPAVMRARGLSKAVVVGHHTGAQVAAEAAVLFPDLVRAIVLNGPLVVDAAIREQFLTGLHVWEKAYKAQPHAAHMVELFDIRAKFAEGSISDERLSNYIVQALTGRGEFWHGHNAAYCYDLAEALPKITRPTLILTNTGDMIYDHAVKTHELRPDFAFAALEGGGVDIVDQQPELWSQTVAEFVRSIQG